MHADALLPASTFARCCVDSMLLFLLSAHQPAVAEQFFFEQSFMLEDAPMWGAANDRLDKTYFLGATWGSVEISQQLDVARLANGVFESSITAGRLGLELSLTSGIAPATTGGAVTANGAINDVIPTKVQFNAPASVSLAERNISISDDWSIGSGFKFTTIGPSLNAKLDFVGSGKVDVRFAGQVLGVSSGGTGSHEGISSGASSTASSYDSGKFTVVDFNNTRVPLIAASSVTARWMPGRSTPYAASKVVNNTAFVASVDAILSMFGAKARIGGLEVYDQSLITKLLSLAESDPAYIFGQTLYAGAPRLGNLTESFSIAVVPEPETWLSMQTGLCLLAARQRRHEKSAYAHRPGRRRASDCEALIRRPSVQTAAPLDTERTLRSCKIFSCLRTAHLEEES